MTRFVIRPYLPKRFVRPLFGDRDRFGLSPRYDDPTWIEWEEKALEFYRATQRNNFGNFINDLGYKILQRVDLEGKCVMEVGPGELRHIRYWTGKPESFTLVDRRQEFLRASESILKARGISTDTQCINNEWREGLPLEDKTFDIIICFYTLEHLHPLREYLQELRRVLKTEGILVGAVPTEGGLAWGLGRLLTSRRWMKHHTGIDPDKIICWEHPNFADAVIKILDDTFSRQKIIYKPCTLPQIDINLVCGFIYGQR